MALLLALCLALCLAVTWSGKLTGPGTIEQASAAPSVPKRFFGFTPDFGAVEDATLTAYYKRLRRGGARWVRFGIYWWYIERNRGNRTWYSTDRFFAATACSGLAALPMFIGSPRNGPQEAPTSSPLRGSRICPSSRT